MPNQVRVTVPAGARITLDPVTVVDSAVASGRIHPVNRDVWLTRLAQGGRVAPAAISTLLSLWPADEATRRNWVHNCIRAAAEPGALDDDDALFARLFPSDEQAAAYAERAGREPDRLAEVDVRQSYLAHNAAARDPWGLPVDVDAAGARREAARLALITALAGLAQALADMRTAQRRLLQATAARAVAGQLATAATQSAPAPAAAEAVQMAGLDTPGPPVTMRPTGPGRPGQTSRPRRPGPAPGPGRPRRAR